MGSQRNYDTVAFDVRDQTSMLFFAKTSDSGDIDDYLLIMRSEDPELDSSLYLEVNETLLAGHDLVRAARLTANVLVLTLFEPAKSLGGAAEIVLNFTDSDENRHSIESGAFRVLGDLLEGGHA